MKYLLLILYAVPWAFLGLYGDFCWRTVWLYFAALAVLAFSGWYLGKKGNVFLAAAGNLLTAVSSCTMTLLLQTERWNAYFKPFGTFGILLLLWSAALLIQALIWRHYRKDSFTGAILWISVLLLLLAPRLGILLAWL